jgi:hypothetical protein
MLGYRRIVRLVAISLVSVFLMWFTFDFLLGVNLPAGLHGPITNRLRL